MKKWPGPVCAGLLAASVILAGCGQKGPLYLPESGDSPAESSGATESTMTESTTTESITTESVTTESTTTESTTTESTGIESTAKIGRASCREREEMQERGGCGNRKRER